MGYSKSKKAIRRVEEYLKQMVAATDVVEFPIPNGDPSKLAFSIRQGIRTAGLWAIGPDKKPVEPYDSYARLLSKYIIRSENGKVVCEPRDTLPIFNREAKNNFGTVSIPEVGDTLEVLGAAMKHRAEEMIFPSASINTIEPDRIYGWARNNGYYLIAAESHVTLTKRDPGDLAWKPQLQ